ncbi:MAG: glycine betaine ABC transporter substrate-binding protein [Desulfohalobiaceae bacterium]
MHKTTPFVVCILVCALIFSCLAKNTTAEKKTVRIGYVEWSCATAASYVVKAVLQEKMGYDCRLVPMQAEEVWLSTASKDIDGFVCAWLPSLHRHFYGKVGYNVLDLGPNLEGTKVGLVVPEYVDIESITELKKRAQKFNKQIHGINPGAGIMKLTSEALEEYKMQDLELIPGSGASMTSTLQEKIKDQEWVVATGWTPHWKFAKWDLKYLQDPKDVYGGSEAIHTVVRNDLKEDKPKLFRFLDNFSWGPKDIQRVMEQIQSTGEPYPSAVSWVEQNSDLVEAWIAE